MWSLLGKSIVAFVRTPSFWKDRWVLALIGLSLVFDMAAFCYVIIQYANLPEFLPLHYNSVGDVDYIGTRAEAFKIPAFGALIWFADIVLGLALYRTEPLATKLLLAASVLAQLLLLAAVLVIIH